MKKIFEATYNGHQIQVENRWFSGERLYVDGELQDENMGLSFRGTLNGKLTNGNHEPKKIKVSLGGLFQIHCKIFVDHVSIPAHKIQRKY